MTEKEIREAVIDKWGQTVEEIAEEWNYPVELALFQLRLTVDPNFTGDIVQVEEPP